MRRLVTPSVKQKGSQERHFIWLLIFSILSVSQALSPYPYLLAVALLVKIGFKYQRGVRLDYLGLATVLIAGVVVSQSTGPQLATLIRLVSSCLLISLTASLGLTDHGTALDIARKFIFATLIASAIGFVYALAGGPPLLTIQNPDGREALLFLSTLSNSVFPAGLGFLIRPSFVFDEPGAYAFVIDFVLIASYLHQRRMTRADWYLITGGLLTFSVAHMIISALIVIGERKTIYLSVIAALAVALDLYVSAQSGVSLIVERFEVKDGSFAGDNRSNLFANGLNIISQYPSGVGASCNYEIQRCNDQYGAFGESPAFPAAFFGVAGALAYYVILLLLLVSILRARDRKHSMVSLSVIALIAQRPFLFSLGYNILILMLFHMVMRNAAGPFKLGRLASRRLPRLES